MPVLQHQQDVFLSTKIVLLLIPSGHGSWGKASELGFPSARKTVGEMGRKKSTDPKSLLSKTIWTRVTEEVFERLSALVKQSDCQNIGEVARRILSKEKIAVYSIDRSMDPFMEELALIRRELNAIGNNINQITHDIHSTDSATQKAIGAIKVADQYKAVGVKVDRLLSIISSLSTQWLQKS